MAPSELLRLVILFPVFRFLFFFQDVFFCGGAASGLETAPLSILLLLPLVRSLVPALLLPQLPHVG